MQVKKGENHKAEWRGSRQREAHMKTGNPKEPEVILMMTPRRANGGSSHRRNRKT